MTYGRWEQSFTLVGNGVGAVIGRGSIGLVEGEGCHFGVAPSVERILLVVGEEVSLVVNTTTFCLCRVWERT